MNDRKYRPDDSPISSPEEDILGQDKAACALVDFIDISPRPLTMSIQGSWGSGKSSLMQLLENRLKDKGNYRTIKVKAWDYFIADSEEDGTRAIIASILESLSDEAKLKERAIKIGQSLQSAASKGISFYAALNGGNGAEMAQWLGASNPNSVESLRKFVNSVIERDPDKTCVFFVDDLDRIEPKVAINILEILKNVFFVQNSVFVIAIDYEIVSKGLTSKYSSSISDEHLHEDYFDKIFQFTYYMPTSRNSSEKLLIDGLATSKYFTGRQVDDNALGVAIRHSASLLGHNPRKIKRLVNNVRYRMVFDKYNEKYLETGSSYVRAACLILTALEIASPEFVKHLAVFADFTKPTAASLRYLNKKYFEEESAEKLDWKQRYARAFVGSIYESKSALIIEALKDLEMFQEADKHVKIRTLLNLSNFIAFSNEDVGIAGDDFDDNVETSYEYGMTLLGEAEIAPNSRVLHLGCQDGKVTKELLQDEPSCRVTAIEMQKDLADAASNTLNQSGIDTRRYDVVYAQIDELPEMELYDTVFSVTAAHWIKEPAYVYSFKSLKPGGKIFFEQSGKGTYAAMEKVLFDVVGEVAPKHKKEISRMEPFFLPSRDALESYLQNLGFVGISIREEVDSGENLASLYEDYISTNALPYISKLTIDEQNRIRELFLSRCHEEKIDKTAVLLWIKAEKPER